MAEQYNPAFSTYQGRSGKVMRFPCSFSPWPNKLLSQDQFLTLWIILGVLCIAEVENQGRTKIIVSIWSRDEGINFG